MQRIKRTEDIALGQEIRRLRLAKGYTVRGFAGLTKLSTSAIHYIESGQTSMSLDTLRRIAKALHLELDIVLCDQTGSRAFVPYNPQKTPR